MSDSDSDGPPVGGARARPAVMHDLWRLLVGQGGVLEARGRAHNNEELVQHLWASGTLKSVAVKRALLACPRHRFVPQNLQDDAYIDMPLRVEQHGFNISAPHIHATALEALEFKEGDRFLDVGCGTGLLAAAAAHLVGPRGSVTAVDIRPAALHLSKESWRQLKEDDEDYVINSCDIRWEQHNIFFPAARHQGQYDKVYIGAACPRDRLKEMFQLLSDQGGLLLVPVESELLLFKKLASGKVGKRVLSAVRFSELEVPRDVDVVLACIEDERRRERTTRHPPSTYHADMAGLLGQAGAGETDNHQAEKAVEEDEFMRPLLGEDSADSAACAAHPAGADWEVVGDEARLDLSHETLCTPAGHTGAVPGSTGLSQPMEEMHVVDVGGMTGGVTGGVIGGVTGGVTGGVGPGTTRERSCTGADVASSPPKRHKRTGMSRRPSYMTDTFEDKLGDTDCFLHGTAYLPPTTTDLKPPSGPPSRPASPALLPPSLTWMRAPSPVMGMRAPSPAFGFRAPSPAMGASGDQGGPTHAPLVPAPWKLPAHKAVLKARCEHFRALFLSGMRDADDGVFAAPDGVSAQAVRCLLHHVYRDSGVDSLPLDQVTEVLHVATYFGCPNLASQCEQRLESVLLKPEEGSDEVAAQLLALADELALPQLKQLSLSYIVEHYERVSLTESYKALPRSLVDAVAAEACRHTAKVLELLQQLSGKQHPNGHSQDANSDDDDDM